MTQPTHEMDMTDPTRKTETLSTEEPFAEIRKKAGNLFSAAEFLTLSVIGVAACWCFAHELWTMASSGRITLGDLLMVFLYSEVIVMVKSAITTHHDVLIRIPISIAIVALARAMVIGGDHNATHQLLQAVAILVLVVSLLGWNLRSYLSKRKSE